MVRLYFPFLLTLVLLPSLAQADEDIFKIGLEALKNKNFPFAVACFHDTIRSDPKSSEAYYYRGMAYDGKGDHEKAVVDFREAARLNPKRHVALTDKIMSAYISWGLACKSKWDYVGAVKAFDEAIRLNPKDAKALNNRGLALVAVREYDRAIKDFTEAIRLDPNFSGAFNNRGFAYQSKGDYENAAKDFDMAKHLNPFRRFQFPPLEFWDRLGGRGWALRMHFTFVPPWDLRLHFDIGAAICR